MKYESIKNANDDVIIWTTTDIIIFSKCADKKHTSSIFPKF